MYLRIMQRLTVLVFKSTLLPRQLLRSRVKEIIPEYSTCLPVLPSREGTSDLLDEPQR